MLTNLITKIVEWSRRKAWLITLAALIVSVALGSFVATHFKINTDVNQLLADDLPWRQREKEMEKAFPQKVDTILAVIDGDTPDNAEDAAEALAEQLKSMPDRFTYVERPDHIPFFQKNGLLFLSQDELVDYSGRIGAGTASARLAGGRSFAARLVRHAEFGASRVGARRGRL